MAAPGRTGVVQGTLHDDVLIKHAGLLRLRWSCPCDRPRHPGRLLPEQSLEHQVLTPHLFPAVHLVGILDVAVALVLAGQVTAVAAFPQDGHDLLVGNAVLHTLVGHLVELRLDVVDARHVLEHAAGVLPGPQVRGHTGDPRTPPEWRAGSERCPSARARHRGRRRSRRPVRPSRAGPSPRRARSDITRGNRSTNVPMSGMKPRAGDCRRSITSRCWWIQGCS